MEIPKAERLKDFFRRLGDAPEATTFDEALAQITNILNEVENTLTSIPYDPDRWQTDGRMYPPLLDAIRDVQDHPAVKRFRSVRHNTFIGENGAIEIRSLDQTTLFAKNGADGRGVWELGRS